MSDQLLEEVVEKLVSIYTLLELYKQDYSKTNTLLITHIILSLILIIIILFIFLLYSTFIIYKWLEVRRTFSRDGEPLLAEDGPVELEDDSH